MAGSSRNAGRRRRSVSLALFTVRVKCSFCRNTFYSRPSEAVCPKCSRPANRKLPLTWGAFSLLIPFFGMIYAIIARSHSPLAALQSFKWALIGTILWALTFILPNLG